MKQSTFEYNFEEKWKLNAIYYEKWGGTLTIVVEGGEVKEEADDIERGG